MNRVTYGAVIAAIAVTAAWPPDCFARLIESWPYEKLLRESDLVVIAEAVSTTDSGETTSENIWKAKFVGVITEFKVHSQLKGKLEGTKLQVAHFRLEQGVRIQNGPLLVSFRMKGFTVINDKAKMGIGKPDYLLFLKRRKDGRYEPVSGQIDPLLSVREMYENLPPEIGVGK
jgi:hypothetical protein